jgi:single stranded DNA-binding protein
MSRGINKVVLVGDLGRPPEMRVMADGTAKATLSLAVNRAGRNSAGAGAQETDWFTVIFWGKSAEALKEYASTGAKLFVEGSLRVRPYLDREGNERMAVEIVSRGCVILVHFQAACSRPGRLSIMSAPVHVRPLSDAEREAAKAGLRSPDAFTLRRCQILLASATGQSASAVAATLGCHVQTVLNAIRAFEATGLACLARRSTRPRHTPHVAFDAAARARLPGLLHRPPRDFGYPTSVWTLALVAEVSVAEGLTATRVSAETVRVTLARLGVRWRRAKRWITSPDPAYRRKKHARDRLLRLIEAHPDWALGFEDEVWWSRLARPSLRAWAAPGQPLRLVEPVLPKGDPGPKALACYGLLVRGAELDGSRGGRVWLRFAAGRPVSAVTIPFLEWCCAKVAALGKRALLLIWDNAPWHGSRAVRAWLRQHHREVKRTGGGVRLLVCFLPSQSPWLNAIEAHWAHGKRRVAEAGRALTAAELADRVCAACGCAHEPHLDPAT